MHIFCHFGCIPLGDLFQPLAKGEIHFGDAISYGILTKK